MDQARLCARRPSRHRATCRAPAAAARPPSASARNSGRRRTAPPAAAATTALASSLPMEYADQSEQAACGIEIEHHLACQALRQHVVPPVVDPAPAHGEALDAVRCGGADGCVVAVADHVVVLYDPPQRR